MPVRVDAAAGPHQRGMHQSLGAPAPPTGASHGRGSTPAAIEGHAETVHRAPPEQGLKPHLRGDHIRRSPGLLKQARRMTTIRTQANAGDGPDP